MTITNLMGAYCMNAIIEIFVLIVLVPFFLFGFILSRIGKVITDNFEPIQLLSCIWLSVVGYSLLPYIKEDNSRAFVSLFEMVAQSHFLGLTLPALLFFIAGTLFFTSIISAKFRVEKK